MVNTEYKDDDSMVQVVNELGQTSGVDNDGNYIITNSGKKFYPLNPRPEDITIDDIAHSLSMQCRYTGHTDRFYSVAEHSILLTDYALDKLDVCSEEAMAYLLHDAVEAYLADLARPIKYMLPGYLEVERIIGQAVKERFNLIDMTDEMKENDYLICVDEVNALFEDGVTKDWQFPKEGLGVEILGMKASRAEREFLALYDVLESHR